MRRFIVLALSFAGLALFLLSGRDAPASAAGPTPVCNNIGNATWSLAGSPYVVCGTGATVPATATLTIQPGVTVSFATGVNARLNVQGTLSALGTVTQTIVFTGPVTPNNWGGLFIDHTSLPLAVADLEYTSLNNGGVAGSSQAAIQVDHGVLTLTHSLVTGGAGSGLWANSSARLTVDSTQFLNNGQDPLRLIEPHGDLPLTNLTASGSPTNSVHIQGVSALLSGTVRWSNPGLPYDIDMEFSNHAGDALTIDPGTAMRFAPAHGLSIGGALYANGAPGQPITFTAQTPAPGMWRGLTIDDGSGRAVAQLDYVTVEYGGGSVANVDVNHGTLDAHHSLIRFSARDGVRFGAFSTGSILNSQIVSNDQVLTSAYGVENVNPTRAVLATNNWWGDPSGPASANAQCPVGHGDRITDFVAARPVLTSTAAVNEFPLSNAPQLELSPQRWFAPANGFTQVYFDITLRDGNGAPLPGRTVHLNIVSGTATKVDGGVTDGAGHTLAYITSSAPDADVDVSASLATNACEFSVSPVSRVHFTKPVATTDLFPNLPAPYVNDNLTITPVPLIAGIPATIAAKLTNPLTVPITVDVQINIVQASIGLAFGPVATINNQVIPAQSSRIVQAVYVPPVSGHYCYQANFTIIGVGGAALPSALLAQPSVLLAPADAETPPNNREHLPASTTPPNGNDSLNKADKIFGAGKHLAPATHQFMLGAWWNAIFNTTRTANHEMGFDPPRQDYMVVSVPVSTTWPAVVAGPGLTAQRAAAINAASGALVNVQAFAQAAAIALDRYGGAAAASNLTWEGEQANVEQYYQQQYGAALIDFADKLDALVLEVNTEGYTDTVVSVAEASAFQARLQSSGFTTQERDDFHNAGMSDADIQAYKQELIATNPSDLSGDLRDLYTSWAAELRADGSSLLSPHNYAPQASVSGTAGQAPAAASSNSMVQVYNTTSTILVDNPTTSTMSLEVRRIDLPADWSAQVSPATVAPGQQVTATVSILAGSPVPQGSLQRVAVEGWVGNQLVGGVEVDAAAPPYVPFDGRLRLYLPITRR